MIDYNHANLNGFTAHCLRLRHELCLSSEFHYKFILYSVYNNLIAIEDIKMMIYAQHTNCYNQVYQSISNIGQIMSQVKLPEFSELNQQLQAASLSVHPDELHGLLSGMLAAGVDPKQSQWQILLHDYTNDGMAWPVSAQKIANELVTLTSEELSAQGFEFSLLVNEDADLVDYAESLTAWVNHFISGLGLGSAQVVANANSQAKEALTDLEEIARLGIDEDDDMQEQALLLEQVIEHVKVCVLTLSLELGQVAQTTPKKTIH